MPSPTIKASWFVAAASSGGAGSDIPITVTSGDNQILYVVVSSRNTGVAPTWTDIKINTTLSMTRVDGINQAESTIGLSLELWQYINPPAGSYNIHPQVNAGGNGQVHFAFLVQDAKQGLPDVVAKTWTDADQAFTPALSLTPTGDGALILTAIAVNSDLTFTPISGDTLVDQRVYSTTIKTAINSFAQSTAAAHSVGATFSGNALRQRMIAWAILPVPANSIAVDDKAAGLVVQRSGTSANIAVSGSYTGAAAASVEAIVRAHSGGAVVKNWTALTSLSVNTGAKTFTGTLAAVPQGGMYTLNVRSKDGGGTVINASANGANPWGVGKLIGYIGSSTAARSFTDAPADTADVLLRKFDTAWAPCTGAAAIAFGNAVIAAEPGVPVGLLNFGVSGTTLKNAWDTTSSSVWIPFAAGVASVGGKLEALYVHVGGNDARGAAITSQSDHEARLRTVFSNARTLTGQATLPIYMSGSQRSPDSIEADGQYWNWARAAELNVTEDANNFASQATVDLALSPDFVHVDVADMKVLGRRLARSFRKAEGETINFRGPKPTGAAVVSSTEIDVTFSVPFGTGLVGRTGSTAVTGFRVSNDNFATMKSHTAAIISPTKVRLTVATGVTSGVTKVDYLTGVNPDVSNCLFDNATTP